jgi:hypothetical protein
VNFRFANIIHAIQKLNHCPFPNDFHECAQGFLRCCTNGLGGIGEEFCAGFADGLGFLLCGGKGGCSEGADEEF